MDKKKQGLLGGGILVLALVAAVGIVYAAYSQSLTINGTANVKANSWNIHFANLSAAQLTGESQEITAPTINNNDTTIGDYSVLLKKPGDSVKYNFDIVNEGTFDADVDLDSLRNINMTPTCTGTGENAEQDAANVCKYLHYGIYCSHEGGEYLQLTVEAGQTQSNCHIELTYDSSVPAEELPKNDVAISGLNASMVFTQCEKEKNCRVDLGE